MYTYPYIIYTDMFTKLLIEIKYLSVVKYCVYKLFISECNSITDLNLC